MHRKKRGRGRQTIYRMDRHRAPPPPHFILLIAMIALPFGGQIKQRRMTGMIGSDCAAMCIKTYIYKNIHKCIHTHTHTEIHSHTSKCILRHSKDKRQLDRKKPPHHVRARESSTTVPSLTSTTKNKKRRSKHRIHALRKGASPASAAYYLYRAYRAVSKVRRFSHPSVWPSPSTSCSGRNRVRWRILEGRSCSM